MKYLLFVFSLVLVQFSLGQAGGLNCADMEPICTDAGVSFTANEGGPDASVIDPGNDYGCLVTSPNPSWFYLEISDAGDIIMELSAPSDIDFIIWGPYADLASAQANCGNHTNIVPNDGCFLGFNCDSYGCSFDITNVETPGIPNAQVGEVYVMLVTNYANNTQQIDLTQTGGNGATDCTIIEPECNISFFEANIGLCDNATGEYEITGDIEFEDAPATGDLIVEDCFGTQHVVASAPFPAGGTVNYTISNLPANGAACDLTAYFSDDLTCENGPLNYNAPTCANCFMTSISVNISACDANSNFEITGEVEFNDPPSSGQLIIQDCNGNSATYNAPFNSPLAFTIPDIPADGTANCSVTAQFTDDAACTITSPNYNNPANCDCTAEVGTFTPTMTGSSNNDYVLCYGDEISFETNNDWIAPEEANNPPGPVYDPGVSWLIYSCPPSIGITPDPNVAVTDDPCLLGIVSDFDFNDVNNLGWINSFPLGTFTDNTIYFVPITMYSITELTYSYVNTTDPCYEMGPVFPVQYLPEIITSETSDCQAGTVSVEIEGGLPEIDGSQFSGSNLLPASASFNVQSTGNGGTIIIEGLVDGDNYSFDITDDNGCPVTITGVFVGVEDPAFDYPNDTYCQDETDPVANITGTPGGTFSATPAGLTINAANGTIDLDASTPGTYTVTYTTPDLVCFASTTYDITIIPVPVIDPVADQVACDLYILQAITGINLSGNEAYYDAPNGGGTQYNAGDNITTSTTLYIYDETGTVPNCSDEETFDVTINITPSINSILDQVECDSYTLPAINGTNLTGNEAYYDATNGGGTQYNPGNNITVPGTTTLYIYDETGTTPNCFIEETFDVTISITPTFNLASTDPTICGANDGTITLSGLEPNTVYEVTYSDGGVPVGPNNMTSNAAGEILISNLSAGTYSDFIVTLNGCTTTDNSSINLIDPNSPSVNAGPDQEICEGEDVALTATNPDGAIINWNNGVNDGVPFNPAVGTNSYTVTADLAGCIATDQVIVTVHPNPVVNAGNDILVCEGESVTLTGSGADSYTWDNGVTNGVSFNPITTQTYTVIGTTVNGCTGTDQVDVEIEPLPVVSIDADNFNGCVPITVTFTNTSSVPGTDCTWNFGDGSTASGCGQVTHTFTDVGCFDVTLEVTSANGCTSSFTENDYICTSGFPNAAFSFTPNELTTINTNVNFNNNSSGASTYEWSFGDGQSSNDVNPTHDYPAVEDSFIVELIATSASGCKDTAYAIINIYEELIFYVPNTFTPDNDDFNEVFKPIFTSGFDPFDYTLLIFNRWGEIVFESKNADVGWDGTYGAESNRIVRDGTYVWKIIFKTKKNDERMVEIGHVNVLK